MLAQGRDRASPCKNCYVCHMYDGRDVSVHGELGLQHSITERVTKYYVHVQTVCT